MTAPRQGFQTLATQFEALLRELNLCQNRAERKASLQRMKMLIDEVDELQKDFPESVMSSDA